MRLVVVGSGVVGASCAYAAVSLGADVVLVDAAMRGRATAAGAGIICPWSSRENDPVWYSFARQAARDYPDLIGRLADDGEPDIGYRQVGAIAHISLGSADTSRWPVVLPGRSGHYMLAFDDSRVVAGATRETGSGFDYRVTPGGLAEVLGEALAVAPGLASGSYAETRVGFRPMGPDIRPLLGPVSAVAGLVVATGLTMGPYAGAVAARAAMGLPTDADLAPLDPLRPPARPA